GGNADRGRRPGRRPPRPGSETRRGEPPSAADRSGRERWPGPRDWGADSGGVAATTARIHRTGRGWSPRLGRRGCPSLWRGSVRRPHAAARGRCLAGPWVTEVLLAETRPGASAEPRSFWWEFAEPA